MGTMKRKDIVNVWRSTGSEKLECWWNTGSCDGSCNDPLCDGTNVIWTWKYCDGTGNAQGDHDDTPYFIDGIAFDQEPANFLDRAYYKVETMQHANLPAGMGNQVTVNDTMETDPNGLNDYIMKAMLQCPEANAMTLDQIRNLVSQLVSVIEDNVILK